MGRNLFFRKKKQIQNKLQQQLKEEGGKESGVQREKGEKEGSPTHFAISMEVFAISYETHLGGKNT